MFIDRPNSLVALEKQVVSFWSAIWEWATRAASSANSSSRIIRTLTRDRAFSLPRLKKSPSVRVLMYTRLVESEFSKAS